MRAGRGDEDHPEIVLAGFVPEGEHAQQSAGSASQNAQPEQHFFGDAPLVRARGVFIETKEQEGEEAEGEEEIKHEIGLQAREVAAVMCRNIPHCSVRLSTFFGDLKKNNQNLLSML